MKKILLLTAVMSLVLPVSLARKDVTVTSTIQRSIELTRPSAPARLIVDNVFGSIKVTGHSRSAIEMTATETYEARNPAALERAKREVRLDIRQRDNTVEFYVDGPFREERNRHRGFHWDEYVAIYEFEIKVPFETELTLKTVNNGEIRVAGVRGDFDVKNVNGDIEMRDVAGSGDVATVNGPVRVWFSENPSADSSFTTINGDLEVHFQPRLSADLAMKTFNGEFWSAFDVEALSRMPERAESKDGKWVIHTKSWTNVRVADGGPRFTFETLNGDVLIRRNDR